MKEVNKLKHALSGIHLSKKEKAEGRHAFIKFMKKNSLPKEAGSGFFSSFYLRMRRPVLASAMAFGLLIASTGGVAYASESSLPGDFLYSFKVDVVEEVQGALRFTPERKAEWDAERMQRRFKEAEQLKDQGKLNSESKSKIKEEIEKHKQSFEGHMEDLTNKGKAERADEMEIEFEPLVEQQERLQEEWKPKLEPTELNIESIDPVIEPKILPQ